MNRLTNPYTAAGIVLLAGFLVGLLTSCEEVSITSVSASKARYAKMMAQPDPPAYEVVSQDGKETPVLGFDEKTYFIPDGSIVHVSMPIDRDSDTAVIAAFDFDG